LDSNASWGQDLLLFKEWMDAHPLARPMRFSGTGLVDPRLAGIDCTHFTEASPTTRSEKQQEPREPLLLPEAKAPSVSPGWYAIDVNFLHAQQPIELLATIDSDEERILRRLRAQGAPTATIGYSILVYEVRPE
jgi:hypothetical protein